MNKKAKIVIFLLFTYGVFGNAGNALEDFRRPDASTLLSKQESSDFPIPLSSEQESEHAEDNFWLVDETFITLPTISFLVRSTSGSFHSRNNSLLRGCFEPPYSPPESANPDSHLNEDWA